MIRSEEERLRIALETSEAFPEFLDFAWLAAEKYIPGFHVMSAVQEDMCRYLQYGPQKRMLQAQRGEGKSYITAFYVVWRLIQDPKEIILVMSAGKELAEQMSHLLTQMIMSWDILEYMAPSANDGDRTGVKSFDIHRMLKGLNKSPSISIVSSRTALPGRRASVVLADDVESDENALTAATREKLLNKCRELSRICTHGDVIFLGTPQTKDSIYNSLERMGYDVRVWPGRYPAQGEDIYGYKLAPMIREAMDADPSLRTGGGMSGRMGKPTDPTRYTEQELQDKELADGPEQFALNYLLDTSLSDEIRLQLKVRDLIVGAYPTDHVPDQLIWNRDNQNRVPLDPLFPLVGVELYYGIRTGERFEVPSTVWCTIDPSGEGADETALTAACAVGDNIHILGIDAFRGGLSEANQDRFLGFFRKYKVTHIRVESNMGHGLFELGLRNLLKGTDLAHLTSCVSGDYSTGQKERRIINTIRPVLERHRLVIHEDVLKQDAQCCMAYGVGERSSFSLFHQMSNITTDRESLSHDDRLDSLAMAVQLLAPAIMEDPQKLAEEREAQQWKEWVDSLFNPKWKDKAHSGLGGPTPWDR